MSYPVVAALYVEPFGAYYGLPDVDPWDEQRDARLYAGPWPVVAHPPCSRWCCLASLVEARYGYKKGDDGGVFKAALAAVRKWGGVLEHPAYSAAWQAFDLLSPPPAGGWVVADWDGGWTCHVEQGRYGHPARKGTWLYAHGVELPSLRWGHIPDNKCIDAGYAGWRDGRKRVDANGGRDAVVSWCRNHGSDDDRPRIGKKAAAATPTAFCDVLLDMARSVERQAA